MSSYWAANHGTALVLSHDEMEAMLEKYIEQNPADTNNEDIFELWEEINDDSRELIRSIYAGIIPNKHGHPARQYFTVTDVSCDYTSGVTLQPYMVNGKPNTPGAFDNEGNFTPNPGHIYHEYDDDVYAIWSDRQLNSTPALIDRPYGSYGELRQEFEDKLKKYLPDGFDWDAHIGVFDYASCA